MNGKSESGENAGTPEFDTLIFHKIPVNLMITGIFLSINDFLCMMYIDVSL